MSDDHDTMRRMIAWGTCKSCGDPANLVRLLNAGHSPDENGVFKGVPCPACQTIQDFTPHDRTADHAR
jgi:hypothetical protein